MDARAALDEGVGEGRAKLRASNPDAPITDFISIQCPSNITAIRVASSQKKVSSLPIATMPME